MLKGKFLGEVNLHTLYCILKSILILLCISTLMIYSYCWADDAMVLPKNRWMTNIGVDMYSSWNKEYNNQGKEQDLAFDYNRELDKGAIGLLEVLENNFKMAIPNLSPDYTASLGQSIVEFEKEAVITNFAISYGVTDKLSFDLKIPYWNFKTKVKADVNKSSATVARHPQDPSTVVPTDILPTLGLNQEKIEALKLTREDILNLLSDGIPELGFPGLGYKRFETWSGNGVGDIELGLKYQYFQNEQWRLAFQGGVRVPSGEEDDPDNLVDYGFGGGNYDFILACQNDYLVLRNLILNGSVRYTNQLSDKTTLRAESKENPLTNIKMDVDRDQGDILELDFSVMYSFSSGIGLKANYSAFFKDKDSVKSEGVHVDYLEEETGQTGHTFLVGTSYSSLSRFQKKLARIPYQVSLNYWNRFDGKNLNKADYYSLKATVFY